MKKKILLGTIYGYNAFIEVDKITKELQDAIDFFFRSPMQAESAERKRIKSLSWFKRLFNKF